MFCRGDDDSAFLDCIPPDHFTTSVIISQLEPFSKTDLIQFYMGGCPLEEDTQMVDWLLLIE